MKNYIKIHRIILLMSFMTHAQSFCSEYKDLMQELFLKTSIMANALGIAHSLMNITIQCFNPIEDIRDFKIPFNKKIHENVAYLLNFSMSAASLYLMSEYNFGTLDAERFLIRLCWGSNCTALLYDSVFAIHEHKKITLKQCANVCINFVTGLSMACLSNKH